MYLSIQSPAKRGGAAPCSHPDLPVPLSVSSPAASNAPKLQVCGQILHFNHGSHVFCADTKLTTAYPKDMGFIQPAWLCRTILSLLHPASCLQLQLSHGERIIQEVRSAAWILSHFILKI